MHDLGVIAGRRLQQQMIVIVHQTIDVNDGGIPLSGRSEVGKTFFPIPLPLEDRLAFIAAGGDVIKCPGILYS
jgi:hypothetical protein